MKIGFVIALEKEIKPFLQTVNYTKLDDKFFNVYAFSKGNKDFVVGVLPNAGEIFATMVTQHLIDIHKVDYVFNFGVVGALKKETSVCSQMFIESVVHYDMDTSAIDNIPQGRYFCFDKVEIDLDKTLLSKALEIRKLPCVRCASADKFVASAQQKSFLAEKFNADICEMELAGIAICCKANGIPCLSIKTVSDSLFGGAEEFETALQKAVENSIELITELTEKI